MKKFITISKMSYDKELTLDYRASFAMNEPFALYVKNSINNNIAYKLIRVTNCKTLSADVTSALTPHYLAGTVIEVNGVPFVNPHPKYRYQYSWVDFNRTRIPKSLAEFKVGNSTFLEELSKVTGNFLPNNLWCALDDYSQQRIAKCKAYNVFNFENAELWYKELMGCPSFKFFSPNAKTRYEFEAEKSFAESLVKLNPGERALTEEEKQFLRKYAPAYGIEIPQFMWRYDYHKTKHGYTREPVRVTGGASVTELAKCYVDPRNKGKQEQLPSSVRSDYMVKSYDNEKLIRDAYFQLIYIMKLKDDSFLMPGYKRCPICHEIYRESEGCEGHVEPITFVQADNLFYGDCAEYHDVEFEQDYLATEEDLGLEY
jgi:hypothetical protein